MARSARAVEIFEDRRFLLREAYLARAVGPDQELRRRLEGVLADREGRVLAVLVLAQLGADAGQQRAEAEGLGDIVVGARVEAEDGVGLGVGGGQHDDRHRDPVPPHQLADLAPVHVGEADVQQDEVEAAGLHGLQRRPPGRGFARRELLVHVQLLGEGLAQGPVVIDDQDVLSRAHGGVPMAASPSVTHRPMAPLGRRRRRRGRYRRGRSGGARGSRTPDLLNAIQALSQLSYGPAIPGAPRGA